MHLVNGTGNSPSPGQPTPGVVKQDQSSGGSVDTTKTRSGPQRVRMSSGESPIGAAKGKQSDTEALCQPPLPPRPPRAPNQPFGTAPPAVRFCVFPFISRKWHGAPVACLCVPLPGPALPCRCVGRAGRDGIFFVPQRPYIFCSSLRRQLMYPCTPSRCAAAGA